MHPREREIERMTVTIFHSISMSMANWGAEGSDALSPVFGTPEYMAMVEAHEAYALEAFKEWEYTPQKIEENMLEVRRITRRGLPDEPPRPRAGKYASTGILRLVVSTNSLGDALADDALPRTDAPGDVSAP